MALTEDVIGRIGSTEADAGFHSSFGTVRVVLSGSAVGIAGRGSHGTGILYGNGKEVDDNLVEGAIRECGDDRSWVS